MFLERLTVRRSVAALAAHWRPHHERNFDLPRIHKAELGGVVDELIAGQHHEVAEHNLHDRAHAGKRETVADPGDCKLADGRVTHAAWKQLAEILGHFE